MPANVLTYADAVDHLTTFMGGSPIDASQVLSRKAVQSAYLRIANERSWQYLYTHGMVPLVAPYSTGTIEYDHTGGSSERLITLSDGTFPTWTKYGRIRIANQVYDIDQRLGNDTATLTEATNPGQDIAADTTYTLFRSVYSLPANFRRISDAFGQNTWWSKYIRPKDWLWFETRVNDSGDPTGWTIAADPDNYGGFALFIQPYSSTAQYFDFVYQRKPRELRLSGYEATSRVGTIANTGTAVTGTNTAFSQSMVGSLLRFGTTALHPDGLGGLNPFAEQVKIRSVTSTTALVLDSTPTTNYSGVKYVVTDPVDLHDSMWPAFTRCCEYEYAMTGRVPKAENYLVNYKQSLILAKEADSVLEIDRSLGSVGGTGPYQFHRPDNE